MQKGKRQTKSGQNTEGTGREYVRQGSFFRQEDGCVGKDFSGQELPAAVAERQVFPFQRYPALRADRKTSYATGPTETANLCHRHGFTKGHFPPNSRRDQQIVWSKVKSNTELFKSENGWRSFASGNVAKVSGAEFTAFGGGLVAELAGIAQSEDRGG